MRHQIELLAPAGSFESLRAAVNAGADAVYIGGSRFGARAYADNPDEEGLCQAIRFAHLHGCDLYLTGPPGEESSQNWDTAISELCRADEIWYNVVRHYTAPHGRIEDENLWL